MYRVVIITFSAPIWVHDPPREINPSGGGVHFEIVYSETEVPLLFRKQQITKKSHLIP